MRKCSHASFAFALVRTCYTSQVFACLAGFERSQVTRRGFYGETNMSLMERKYSPWKHEMHACFISMPHNHLLGYITSFDANWDRIRVRNGAPLTSWSIDSDESLISCIGEISSRQELNLCR